MVSVLRGLFEFAWLDKSGLDDRDWKCVGTGKFFLGCRVFILVVDLGYEKCW